MGHIELTMGFVMTEQVDLTSTFIKAIPERNKVEDLIHKSSNYPKVGYTAGV